MKEVILTFLLYHDNGNNMTDHDKSSDDTANDDAKVIAYRKKVSVNRLHNSIQCTHDPDHPTVSLGWCTDLLNETSQQ